MPPRRIVRLLVLLALALAHPLRAAELVVFAAASLADALQEISPLYARTSGHALRLNLGASGLLVRQIEAGAPADLFLSADEARMDRLEKADLLAPGTRRPLLANTLVLVIPSGRAAPADFPALAAPAVKRLALGAPATVPAGDYARQHLTRLGLWTDLEPKVVQLDNVRAVLAAVESGDADAGVVYRTDALSSNKVTIARSVPRDEGPAIQYPGAVLRASRSPEAARALLAWLQGPEARAVFARHGFLEPRDP